jgi:hypothetical protein
MAKHEQAAKNAVREYFVFADALAPARYFAVDARFDRARHWVQSQNLE